jgi:hypothetical protein
MSAALVAGWELRVWLVGSSLGKDRSTEEGVNIPCTQGRMSTECQRHWHVCCVPRRVHFPRSPYCPKDTPLDNSLLPSSHLSTRGAGLSLADERSEKFISKVWRIFLKRLTYVLSLLSRVTHPSCLLTRAPVDGQHKQMALRYSLM